MKEQIYSVYKITNKLNNKIYIGGTSNSIQKRFRMHLAKALKGFESPLYRAIREFGEENFDISVVETCKNSEELDNREIYWIANLSSTNPEIGYNVKAGGNIFYHNTSTKSKISRIHKGKVSEKREAILQYDCLGNFVAEYPSLTEAANKNNICRSSIIRGLKKEVVRPTKNNNSMWFYKDSDIIDTYKDPNQYYKNINYKPTMTKACSDKSNIIKDGDCISLSVPVAQYDLNNKLIAKYYSLSEASRNSKVSIPTIRKQLNDPTYLSKLKRLDKTKYIWRACDKSDPDIQISKEQMIKNTANKLRQIIRAYDDDWNLVKTYYSVKEFEAGEHADRRTMLLRANTEVKWRDYYWTVNKLTEDKSE